jgi:phosphatidylglycerophosphatase GEP4
MIKGLNWHALKYIPRVFSNKYLLIPSLSAPDIRYLNFNRMKNAGIKAICFDKDNVLTAHKDAALYATLNSAWDECKRVFGNKNLAIISNSAGSSDDISNEWALNCESLLEVTVIRHPRVKKPDCGELIFRHFQYQPHHIAFVGDRLMTDILMGNLNEMFTIHTQPLTVSGEPLLVRSVM